jgi:hypothetical protein
MLALFDGNEALMAAYEATKPKPPPTPEESVALKDGMLEAEAVADFLWHPDRYTEKLCKQCNRQFLTNRPKFVSLCSVECMKKTLEETGLDWDPLVPLEDRWKRLKKVPDMIVPPEALGHLRSLLFPDFSAQEQVSEEVLHTEAS